MGSGQIPNHLSLYHGADTTLQGELRVAGVNVMVEGVVNNVENLTVVDGGRANHVCYELTMQLYMTIMTNENRHTYMIAQFFTVNFNALLFYRCPEGV